MHTVSTMTAVSMQRDGGRDRAGTDSGHGPHQNVMLLIVTVSTETRISEQ